MYIAKRPLASRNGSFFSTERRQGCSGLRTLAAKVSGTSPDGGATFLLYLRGNS